MAAYGSRVKFTVDRGAVNRMFQEGGQVDRYVEGLAKEVEQECIVTAPRSKGAVNFYGQQTHKPGTLAGSIRRYRDGRKWIIEATAPYAAAVHQGRRAMTIVPRRKKALSWGEPDGGDVAFVVRKRVKQPARKGNPWMRRALQRIIH